MALATVSVGGLTAGVPAGEAVDARVVAAGRIEVVADPGIALRVPGDGRLNGDGFAAEITGYRFAFQVGFGGVVTEAASGQRLLVFGLQGAPLVPDRDAHGDSTPVVHPLLIVDGAEEALPIPADASGGPTYFLASVPATARQVALQIANQGFSQTFSFTAGARLGPSPVALYRTRGSWQTTDPVKQTVTLSTPDPTEGIPDAALDVTVNSATLTWFGPDNATETPTSPDEAWLVLNAVSQPHSTEPLPLGSELNYLSTLTGSQVTLTTPGDPSLLPATITGQGGPNDESQDQSGLFGGTYYWQVPADLTSATVTILPGTISAESNNLGSPQTITVQGSASFPVSFGDVYRPPPPPSSPPPVAAAGATHPKVLAPKRTTQSTVASGPTVRGADAGSSWVWIILAVIAALAAGSTLAVVSRRRRQPRPPASSPADRPPDSPAVLTPDVTLPDDREEQPQPTLTGEPVANGPESSARTAGGQGRPVVKVLGPVELSGFDVSRLRPVDVELIVFLAFNTDRPVTGDAIRMALGQGKDRDPTAETVRTYASRARQVLGVEHFPAAASDGYRLVDVDVDLVAFEKLLHEVETSADPDEEIPFLSDALGLVRGVPLTGARYEWADTGPLLGLQRQILETADRLATLAVERRQRDLGAWAVSQGLKGLGYADEQLLTQNLRVAAIAGPLELDWAWKEAEVRLAAQNDQPGPTLTAAYQELNQRQQ